MNYLYASTNLGCEKLLENELIFLGAKNLNITKGGIYYEAEDLLLYKSLIWSRIASRIFICIKNLLLKITTIYILIHIKFNGIKFYF